LLPSLAFVSEKINNSMFFFAMMQFLSYKTNAFLHATSQFTHFVISQLMNKNSANTNFFHHTHTHTHTQHHMYIKMELITIAQPPQQQATAVTATSIHELHLAKLQLTSINDFLLHEMFHGETSDGQYGSTEFICNYNRNNYSYLLSGEEDPWVWNV